MNKNKRDVLKGLAVGSVWATPVVSSVVLPVHASTSCDGLVDVSIVFTGTGTVSWEIYAGVNGNSPEELENPSGTAPLEVNRTLPEGTTEVWLYASANTASFTQTISCCNVQQSDSGVGSMDFCAIVDTSNGACSLTDTSQGCR